MLYDVFRCIRSIGEGTPWQVREVLCWVSCRKVGQDSSCSPRAEHQDARDTHQLGLCWILVDDDVFSLKGVWREERGQELGLKGRGGG